jgi:hypothetical protein
LCWPKVELLLVTSMGGGYQFFYCTAHDGPVTG